MVACPRCNAENDPSGPLGVYCKKCGSRLNVSAVRPKPAIAAAAASSTHSAAAPPAYPARSEDQPPVPQVWDNPQSMFLRSIIALGVLLIALSLLARLRKSNNTDFGLMFLYGIEVLSAVGLTIRSRVGIVRAILGGFMLGAFILLGVLAYDYPRTDVDQRFWLLVVYLVCLAGIVLGVAAAIRKGVVALRSKSNGGQPTTESPLQTEVISKPEQDSLSGQPSDQSPKTKLTIDVDTLISGRLPQVCIVCGQPSTSTVARKFAARVSGYMVQMKKKAPIPVCENHRSHWRNMYALLALVFISGFAVWVAVAAAGLGLMTLVRADHKDLGIAFGLGGLFCGLICYGVWVIVGAKLLRRKLVTAAGFQGNSIILDNVSREFARDCQQQVSSMAQRRF